MEQCMTDYLSFVAEVHHCASVLLPHNIDGELIHACDLVVKVLASAVCGDFEATVLTHVCNYSCSVRPN